MAISFNQIVAADLVLELEEEERVMNEVYELEQSISSPKSKKMKFSFELDHSLLLETTTVNPFSNQSKWPEVSNNVTEQYRAISKDETFIVSSRACKDRVNHLLKLLKQKTESAVKTLKRGCTPDEYETKVILLEGIETLQSTAGRETTKSAKSFVKSVARDKEKGEAIRHAAMTTHVKRKTDESDQAEVPKKSAKPGGGKQEVIMEYIKAKRIDERILEERRIKLEERRLELEEKKADDERRERLMFWENAQADRQLQLDKLKAESEEKKLLYNLVADMQKRFN